MAGLCIFLWMDLTAWIECSWPLLSVSLHSSLPLPSTLHIYNSDCHTDSYIDDSTWSAFIYIVLYCRLTAIHDPPTHHNNLKRPPGSGFRPKGLHSLLSRSIFIPAEFIYCYTLVYLGHLTSLRLLPISLLITRILRTLLIDSTLLTWMLPPVRGNRAANRQFYGYIVLFVVVISM